MVKTEKKYTISLILAKEIDLPEFTKKLQEAFAVAVVETFGDTGEGPIPPDEEIQESFRAPGAVIYHIFVDDKKVGGAVLSINNETQHNSMDLFFISPEYSNRGIGLAAWKAIEKKHPETVSWELGTPYFEKRNINFYVNKCGFHIVEFYNEHHPDPHESHNGCNEDGVSPDGDGFFRFEKLMK